MLNAVLVLYFLGWLVDIFAGLIWWAALLQQKEYRWDRLHAHLNSLSGRQVLFHLLPSLGLIRPMTFKRPVKTMRVKMLLVSTLLVITLITYSLIPWIIAVPALQIARLFVLPVLLYLCAPALLLFFTIVMNGAVWLITTYNLYRVGGMIRARNIRIIGITGSFGKTTTKQLLAHVLQQRGRVCTTPGSVNTALGIARYLISNLGNADTLVLEYAAYCPGEIARLAAVLPPDVAILTGLGKQHIELFGSQKNIAQAKAELLEALPDNAKVYCANESALKIVSAAKNNKALQVEKTWLAADPKIKTAIVGDHFVNTLKVVAAVAQDLGFTPRQIGVSLESFVPTEKWIQRRTAKSGVQIIDDAGTSNPDGFLAALRLFSQEKAARKILITAGIVDLGSESKKIHGELASEATLYVSEVWYLGAVGRSAFAKNFAGEFIVDEAVMRERLQGLDANTALLIEGRIPFWLEKLL